MPTVVTLPDGSERTFPDGVTDADIAAQLGGAFDLREPEPINPAVALRRRSGIPDAPGVGSGILGTVAEFAKALPRGTVSSFAGTSRAGAEVSDFLTRNLGLPPSPIRALESATAQFLERKTREALPADPDYEWAPAIGEGVGQVIPAMIGGGFIGSGVKGGASLGSRLLAAQGAAKTAGAVASSMTFGPEFMDAFDRATEQGDDPNTAFAKSLGYATLASAIENRFGVGRLAGKLAQSWTPDLVKTLAKRGVAREILKDAGINFAEEASQRAAQDLIITGELDQEGVVKEGLVGAAVATLIGAPANVASRPRPVSQAQKDAVWDAAFKAEPGPEKDTLVEYAEAVSSLPSLRKPEPRLKVYEREARRAGFDLANVVFDPTPRIVENERAIAELAEAQAVLAAGPNPEIEARLPELLKAAQEKTSVEASYDPSADQLTIHLPAIKSQSHLRDILREERGHRTLATPEGREALVQFLAEHPLSASEVEELKAYKQRPDESDGVYRARLSDEYLAKLNRGSWWKRWTGEAVAWLKSKFGWELTNEQAGRLVLRNLRKVAGQAPVAGTRRESATEVPAWRAWAASLPKADDVAKDRPNNVTDSPYSGDFVPGQLFADAYGENPYVYEARMVDPRTVTFDTEGKTLEQVLRMPTTQRYVEWYRAGSFGPPISVVIKDATGKPHSTNRRRVVAAIEAGVPKIPALVEVGRAKELAPATPQVRESLAPIETYPTAPIVPVDQPGIRTENGLIQVGPDVTGDDPALKAAVAEAGVKSLPDPYLEEVILPILQVANPRLAADEARKTGRAGAPLARHLLALEMQDWRIREASGFLPWRMLYRLAQALRLAITPKNERAALKAIRRVLEASAEQYRTGEPVAFNAEDQRQVFVDRNARMAGIVAPLVRSLRARLSEDRALYSREFRAAQDRLNELATLARTRRLGEQIQQNFNPRSAKFLEEISDAGVVPSERDVALWREYQTELKARGLARKMDALEAAEASLANIARIDPRLDVAALKRRVDRLTKSIAKADVPTTERARVIRADRKAALDRDAAARVLEDPQIAEWAELLAAMEESGLQPRPVTGTAAADVQEAGNYFAMEFDEFAQRVQSELDSFTEERFQPRIRALKDRLTALKKTEGETEVAIREVLAAARGKADRSGSAMSREAMAAMREIDAQIVRFAFGLAQAAPDTSAGKLRDALLSGEVPVLDPGMAGLREVASSVGLAPEITEKILRMIRDDPEFRLVVEEMFDSSEKAVREHVLTTIELIEDVYAEGKAQLAMPDLSENEQKAIKTDIARKSDELARRALARMRRDRNSVRRGIRDAERDVFDLSAELLEKQTLAGLAKAGLEQLGENRPHVRRMVYMAPGKGGEVLAEFGDQPEVRIPPDQAYTETTIHSITVWMANARKAIEEQSEDAPTLRGLEIGIKKAASLVERMFTPDHLEKTLRPNALLDAFASSWLRTPAILSKLVPGIWSRLIDQRRADRDKAVRKANAIQQRTASKRRKLIVSAAESLGLDLFRRSGDPGILFDAYNEVAHQLRQHGSGVEVGQRFWLLSLRNRGARITSELLNLIRFDRAVGKELQNIEELRPYGGVRMRTGRGREIVRPSAPTGDIGLARLPKQQPLEDLVAAYDRAKASYPDEPQRERDAQLDFWNDNVDAVASHIRDASRNDLLDERDPLLGPAEEALTRAITSGGQEMPETIGAWVTALADRLPKIGPWGNVETPMGAPNPDGIEARVEWAETALLGELSRYVPLARQRVAREQNGPARSSLEVAVRDDQNEFTMGAAQLAFPSAWYQYGASDSYRDMVNRITAPATVEYANSLDNAAKDLRTKAARIEDAKKQADPGPALEELAADIRWHTGAKGPISVDLAERAADKMKRRAQAIEDYASKLRNPDFRTPPLPARLLSFSYGALLSTPTSWASNVFGGPITAYPVLSQFMAGPKAGLAMAGLLGASPIHGLLWEGSPFFPGLRKIGEWTGLLGPNETVAFLEGEGTGASWSRLDAADAEAWSAGQVTGKRARAAYERLKEAITGLSNVAGVGRGDVATNLLNARVTVPLALKALQGQARIAEAAKTAGVELPATDVTLKTREFLSAYGDPDTVLTEIAAMDARRWWKTELGATLGYDILTQLNVASASNRPDTNWLVGLLGWTSQTLALFLGNSRLPANASALRKGAKYLIAPTAMALASALSFWVQAGGRAWTKETFAKLSGELAIALSGVPDEGPGDDDERFYWRALDWLSDNVARVLALLHVTWATAPASAIAGGIARSFQPAARPMPWEQGFWLRPGSQIVADIADSATGGIGFSVTDPSLPAISLLKNAVKSSTQVGRGILGLADGEETRAAAFADIKGGARGAANFLGAWGAALAEAVLPGGNAGRESRRLIQSAARDAGIVLRPGEAPDGWSAPLSLRKELLAAGVRYVEGDESAIETIRGLASFSWQRAYDRAIEQGSSVSEAEDKASNAVKAMLPSLDPVRNALGRSAKAEELAKLGAALASPAVQRDTKAARAVVDVLERRPPARMRSFRASASARSPLKAGRRSAGPKARSKLRLSVPRV